MSFHALAVAAEAARFAGCHLWPPSEEFSVGLADLDGGLTLTVRWVRYPVMTARGGGQPPIVREHLRVAATVLAAEAYDALLGDYEVDEGRLL